MTVPTITHLNSFLADAALQSFGINKQFFELEFSNLEYESIKFTIDCEFEIDDESIMEKLIFLREIDPDVYKVSYFTYLNRQRITSISLNGSLLNVLFSNELSLIFKLDSDDDTPLAITLIKDYFEPGRLRVLFDNYGGMLFKE